MKELDKNVFIIALALVLIVLADAKIGDADEGNLIGKTTAEIVRLRGFKAQDHYVTTDDGYILNVVRCTNPKVNRGNYGSWRKSVVLFVHGFLSNAKMFIAYSEGVQPKTFWKLDAKQLSEWYLDQMLMDEPSKNSLPFLLMNFGHEVWLLNRRGSPGSLGRVDGLNGTMEESIWNENNDTLSEVLKAIAPGVNELTTATEIIAKFAKQTISGYESTAKMKNADYWNYSMDEQAQYDLPNVIDYILRVTGRRKVNLVGHSMGAAIILMALADQPDLASKVGQAVLWAPALNLGHSLEGAVKLKPLILFTNYMGPFRHFPTSNDAAAAICSKKENGKDNSICKYLLDALYGKGDEHRRTISELMVIVANQASGHEAAQLGQNLIYGGVQHHFDFGSKLKNIKVYGKSKPPAYDLSKIKLRKLSLFAGKTDGMVSPEDAQFTRESLSFPVDFQLISHSDNGTFNHQSFIDHDKAGELCNIPTLMRLESTI